MCPVVSMWAKAFIYTDRYDGTVENCSYDAKASRSSKQDTYWWGKFKSPREMITSPAPVKIDRFAALYFTICNY